MLPAAGLILLVALLIAATLVPWLTGTLAARAEARQAAARGELTASVVDLIEGAPELAVNGATAEQLGRRARGGRGGDAARRRGRPHRGHRPGPDEPVRRAGDVGRAASSASRRSHAGRLEGVLLAGIALIPLVAFELVTGLPGATQTLQRVRRSAARVFEVMDTPPPVRSPRTRSRSLDGPRALRVRDLRYRYPGQTRWALDRSRSRPEPGPARGGGRPERRRQVDARRGAAALPPLRGRLGHARRRRARRARRR